MRGDCDCGYEVWVAYERDASRAAEDAEEAAFLASLENGENNMTIAQEVGLEGEHSGVLSIEDIGGIRLVPTVEDLDELPEPAQLSEDVIDGMIEEARDSLALLSEANRTALILTELCHLPDEAVAMISAQSLQLLGNKNSHAALAFNIARDARREAELHVINALGPFRAGFETGK